ncbi:hypothetical protein FNF29_02624 [Cafeteria roenbergensis]|uniref:Uncharacterized protein n=1 Tax=Cafeteria roenbergensis TaxID=33653 RepID=A0A5A8CP77_CAFRO|nr:hypothetical protein FNF29_02624 [Cafeteria roenbergensis]|eukprot:KAA0154000.1 hypothetical protein FNF29_02624 [Cafeteria roenbergensis]
MATDAPAVARPAPELSEEDSKAVKSALRWSKLSAGVLVATTVFQVATGSGFGALLSAVLLVMTLCCGVRGLRQGNGTKVLWHARAHACCACLIVVFVIPAIFIALAAYNCACSVECRQMFLPNPADFAPAGNASGFAPGGFNRSSGASPSGFRNGFAPAQHHGGPPRADEMRPAGHPDKPAGHKPAEGEPHREIAPAVENIPAPAGTSRRLSGTGQESEGHHGKRHGFASKAERRAAKAARKAARKAAHRAARRAASSGGAPTEGEDSHGDEHPLPHRHGKAHAIAQAVFKTFMGHIGGSRDTPAGAARPRQDGEARPRPEDRPDDARPRPEDRPDDARPRPEDRPDDARPRPEDRPDDARPRPEDRPDDARPRPEDRPGDMKMDTALRGEAAAPAVQPRLGANARRTQANSNHRSGPPRPNGGAPAYGSARSGSHHESSGWHSAWHSHSHDDEDEAAFSWHSGRDSGKRDDRPRGGFGGRWSPHGDEDEDLTREEVATFVAEATEKMDMMCTVSNGMSAPAVFLAIVVSTLLAGIHAPAQRPAGPGAHAAAAGDDYPFSAPAAAPASGGFMSRIRGMVAQQRGYATVETFDDAPPRAAPVGAGTAAVAPPQQAATAPPPVSYEEYLRLVAASS